MNTIISTNYETFLNQLPIFPIHQLSWEYPRMASGQGHVLNSQEQNEVTDISDWAYAQSHFCSMVLHPVMCPCGHRQVEKYYKLSSFSILII